MNRNLKEIAAKSSTVLIISIIGNFVSLISMIVVGRLLGADTYGKYIYIVSFLSIISILPLMGMNQGLISFLSRDSLSKNQKGSLTSFAVVIGACASFAVIFLLYIFKDTILDIFLDESYRDLFTFMIPIVVLNVILPIAAGIMRGYKRTGIVTTLDKLIRPITSIIIIVVMILVFSIRDESVLVASLYASRFLILFIYIAAIVGSKYIRRPKRMDYNKQLILFSIPLLLNSAVGLITTNIDKYMIGTFLNSQQVGIYNAALQFGVISSFVLIAVNSIFAPIISNLYHSDKMTELKNLYRQTTKIITMFNFMVLGLFVILSDEIMRVPGDEFAAGAVALVIICVGQIANALSGSVGQINIMTGHSKYELISSIITMVINVILNIILIPIYGINGAALATAFALFTRSAVSFIFMYRKLKIHPFDSSYLYLILALVLSTAVGFFAAQIISVHFVVKIIISGSIYAAAFMFIVYKTAFKKEEINQIKSMIGIKMGK